MPLQKKAREQSPLQQVCMQYGKDCRRLSNSYELAKLLRESGEVGAAQAVEGAIQYAKNIVKQKYFYNRKAIQPDWKDWNEQRKAGIGEILW